jgi:hypothetical protein
MSKHRYKKLPLGLIAWLVLVFAPGALAEDFSLMIASPVAAGNYRAKAAVFVLRPKNCAEPAAAEVRGTAEGLVGGMRRTMPLAHLTAMPTPGVYAVNREWPAEGAWVVNLVGKCGTETAGALVPIGPKGFLRESSQFFSRPASKEEIDESLKSLAAVSEEQPGAKP